MRYRKKIQQWAKVLPEFIAIACWPEFLAVGLHDALESTTLFRSGLLPSIKRLDTRLISSKLCRYLRIFVSTSSLQHIQAEMRLISNIVVAFILTATVSVPTRADLLLNPSFESSNVDEGGILQFGTGQTVETGWLVESSFAYVIDPPYTNGVTWPAASDGDQLLFLFQNARLRQDVDLNANTQYQLNVDFASFPGLPGFSPELQLDFLRDGNSILGGPVVFTRPPESGFATQTFQFSTTLGGMHSLVVSTSSDGANVDNFRLSAVTAVPEPASLILVGTAAGLSLCSHSRRRRRASTIASAAKTSR